MRNRFLYCLLTAVFCYGDPHPIQFSIPESKIVKEVPAKDRDFAFITPKNRNTYIYRFEKDYYRDYQRSYFAVTCRKGGWDCMRHYEILANGCIPYFEDLEHCPSQTMCFLPKELIQEAMNLPGVHYKLRQIDHAVFDHEKYHELVTKMLDHTRAYLTTRAMAEYMLKAVNYTGSKPILFLSHDLTADYLRCVSLIGLKQILGGNVVDYPKVPHIYKDYPGNPATLWGRGFSYTKILDVDATDRTLIDQRIQNREFELVIYGSLHRGLPLLSLVQKHYRPEEIIFLCGGDHHRCSGPPPGTCFFLREWDCYQ